MRQLRIGEEFLHGGDIFILNNEDDGFFRYRQCYILGQPGRGKSTLINRMVHQDIYGVRSDGRLGHTPYATIVFDAGDLASDIVKTLPQEVIDRDRVLWFSLQHPYGYNPLMLHRNEPGRLENEILALVDQITVEGSTTQPLSARMKRVLSIALEEVLKDPQANVSTLCKYFASQKLRLKELSGLDTKDDSFNSTYWGVYDRLNQFMRDARLRRILCRPHELDFNKIIDEGLVLIVSLAGLEKPLIRIIGTILLHGLMASIFDRSIEERRDVAVYIDEFQDYVKSSYAVENFQQIFAQGRKHKVSLTVAHQDFSTIDSKLLHNVHSTASSIICFGCGPEEAYKMSRVFHGRFPPEMIGDQPNYRAVAKVNDIIVQMNTFEPPKPKKGRPDPETSFKWAEPDPPNPFALANGADASKQALPPEPPLKHKSFRTPKT